MIMTKTPVLIMLRFDSFVQGREVHLEGERDVRGARSERNGRSGQNQRNERSEQRGSDRNRRSRRGPQVLENFVVLEGLDGSGTTTQLLLADEALDSRGVPHFCTGEPTKGPVGRIIRQILKRQIQARAETVALLFAADRNEHLYEQREGILSHLRQGELVVCDRYLFSSLAYQSLTCDPEFVFFLNRRFPLPQHLVFLDTPVAVSQQRLTIRSADGPELYDGREIQQDILSAYEQGFLRFPDSDMRLHRLDGSRDPELVFEKFWSILASLPIVKG
jgi:dTMP kinase